MSTLIIHLSDLHLQKNKNKSVVFDKMIDSLKIYENKCQNCFLIFTGDCTQSGKHKDFVYFGEIIGSLLNKIETTINASTHFIVVPGNHDNDMSNDCAPKIEDIHSKYKISEREVESLFFSTMQSMKCAHSFCRKYGFDFFNKAIAYWTYEINQDINYHFVLVDSAPFSCLEHVDKDVHFIPKDEREIVSGATIEKETIELLVSHHRPDWFEEKSKESIDSFQENVSSICFFGHDHKEQVESISIEENIIISKGGKLFISNNELVGSFNTFLIDEDNKQCISKSYKYENKYNRYIEIANKTSEIRSNNCLRFKREFIEEIINPEITSGLKEANAFVFPTLRPNGKQEYIDSIDGLFSFLNSQKKLLISGSNNSGKSTILHRIFEQYNNKMWRIIIDCSNLGSSNIERYIKHVFDDEYKYSSDFYLNFNNDCPNNKIILLDNFDKIQSASIQKSILDYCESKYGVVVLSTNDLDIKTYKKAFGDFYDSDYSFDYSFTISGFSIKKRNELYKRICESFDIKNNQDVFSICSSAELAIKTCSIVDMSDPYYLCVLVSNIIEKNLYIERNTSDAFNVVFEYSIQNALVKAGGEAKLSNLDSILRQLAFNITFIKKSIYFDSEDLLTAFKEVKDKFKNISISFDSAVELLKKSKLIRTTGDQYRFQRNSYIAYFASKEVVRLYQRGETNYLTEAVKNIVFGINGDVFLFAAYQLKQVKVFIDIQDFLSDILKGFQEINFKEKNNSLLIKNTILKPETTKQRENKEEFYDRIDQSERKRISMSNEIEDSVYDKNFDEQTEAILKAIKMIEISSKAIAGFDSEIEAGERELLIEYTLSSALKLVNLVFSFSKEDIDDLNMFFEEWKEKKIKQLKDDGQNSSQIKRIKELNIVHALYDFLVTWILNLES